MTDHNELRAAAERLTTPANRSSPYTGPMHVLHRCDVRLCVNPDHLFLGTPKDNADDMRAKGRGVKGGDQGCAVLTPEAVDEIRRRYRRYSRTDGTSALAKEFGIGPVQVWRVAKGKQWRHV